MSPGARRFRFFRTSIVPLQEQFRSFIERAEAKFEKVEGVFEPGGFLKPAAAKKVLIYARCSTTQHDQRPEVQVEELRRYCEARGFEVCEEVVDHGFSGSTEKRPGLKRLQELVRSRDWLPGRKIKNGGEGEIRTHEPREGSPVFKTGAINRSATSPCMSELCLIVQFKILPLENQGYLEAGILSNPQ